MMKEQEMKTIKELEAALSFYGRDKLKELVKEAKTNLANAANPNYYERFYGCLHVSKKVGRSKKSACYYVSYNGNMGSSLERNVKPNFQELYGKGSWAKARKGMILEEGHPSYSWYMKIPADYFEKHIIAPSLKKK